MLSLEEIESKEFWKGFDQDFHIEELEPASAINPKSLEESTEVLNKEGYYHYQEAGLQMNYQGACNLIKALVQMQLPPIFVLVYDEFWQLENQLSAIVSNILGKDARLIPAIWAWCVETNADNIERHENNPEYNRSIYSSFIEPHRDKGKDSLNPDGSAKSITTWIPLNECNPLNSCIHLVPAHKDRNYNTELQDNWNFNYADIRALPAKPGDVLIWNQAVLHWGSMPAARDNQEPRISIGFDYVAKPEGVNYPIDYMPSFEERRYLIALQIMQYIHKMESNEAIIDFIKKYREPVTAK